MVKADRRLYRSISGSRAIKKKKISERLSNPRQEVGGFEAARKLFSSWHFELSVQIRQLYIPKEPRPRN